MDPLRDQIRFEKQNKASMKCKIMSNNSSFISQNKYEKDDLQMYSQDYDLSAELGFKQNSGSKDSEHRSNSESVSTQELKLVKENQRLLRINKLLNDRLKKLDVNTGGMHFANERKPSISKNIYNDLYSAKEKADNLQSQLTGIEAANKELSQQLADLQEHNSHVTQNYERLKDIFEQTIQNEVKKVENQLNPKIKQLEYDYKVVKAERESFKQLYDITKNSKEIANAVEKLSIMLLSKRYEVDFLSYDQKKLIKELLGDHITAAHHNKYDKSDKKNKTAIKRLKNSNNRYVDMSLKLLNMLLAQPQYRSNDKLLQMKIE